MTKDTETPMPQIHSWLTRADPYNGRSAHSGLPGPRHQTSESPRQNLSNTKTRGGNLRDLMAQQTFSSYRHTITRDKDVNGHNNSNTDVVHIV